MKTPRYLIAKYIPDLGRLEPRNIGVIVWSPDGVAARFLAEKVDRPGEVDGRSIPSWVTSSHAYKQWIRFWRGELSRSSIQSFRGRERIPRDSPAFLDSLQATGRGNFVLAEGGFLLDAVPADELSPLADRLFTLLVETTGPDDTRDPSLDELCDQLIEETRLSQDVHFHRRFEVVCRLTSEVEERFEFSYAYRNGSLQRLYQRMPLARRKGLLRKTVHDAAWMFEKVVAAGIIRAEQGAVLVNVTPEQKAEPEVDRSLNVIASVTRVLNLNDYELVRAEFQSLHGLTSP